MKMDDPNEFPVLTHECFEVFRKIALSHAGIVIGDKKEDMMYGRLLPRLRQLKLKSFNAYFNLIASNPEEESKFINLMTNATTGFFRESHHFKMLNHYLTHELLNKSRIRIWSAGCATGEESYSIAIVVDEAFQKEAMRRKDIKILATDIDSDCLDTAERGIYELSKVSTLKLKDLKRFYRGIGNQAGYVRVIERIRNLVTFKRLNLIEKWPIKGPFDIIFCRNVTIYFDQKITERILYQMDKLIKPNGLLILGHSEHIYGLESRYILKGENVYQKLQEEGR